MLVHAGTGGVGLAAINIATALKCPIFATAGTPQKRLLLRGLGVQATASSRDTSFSDLTGCQSGSASRLQRACACPAYTVRLRTTLKHFSSDYNRHTYSLPKLRLAKCDCALCREETLLAEGAGDQQDTYVQAP